MNDRGEKIITLAREMLRTEFPNHRFAEAPVQKTQISLKTLYLTVFLTAFSSGALTTALDEARRPINRQERVELDALLFYTARKTSTDEDAVRRDVMERFSLQGLNNLKVYDYHRARDYLLGQLH
jgi:hypothetical protein